MKVTFDKDFPDVAVLAPSSFADERGSFSEVFNEKEFQGKVEHYRFVQENESVSYGTVIRGLHYQLPHPQGKLVRVLSGGIKDLILDLRKGSKTFGKYKFFILFHGINWLWIPPGYAHGFISIAQGGTTKVLYKTTDYYHPECEQCIRYNDPTLNIPWGEDEKRLVISEKDGAGSLFEDAKVYEEWV